MEYYAISPYSNELYHHGVKGMKWGVRKAASNYAASARRLGGNIANKGLLRGSYQWHAQNVSKRLNNMSDKRKKYMSNRQLASYNASKKYWDQKAAGTTNRELKRRGEYRGIVKRTYDSYRSRSLGARTAIRAVGNTNNALLQRKQINDANKQIGMGLEVSYKDVAAAAVKDTAVTMVGEEIVSRLFGHY